MDKTIFSNSILQYFLEHYRNFHDGKLNINYNLNDSDSRKDDNVI